MFMLLWKSEMEETSKRLISKNLRNKKNVVLNLSMVHSILLVARKMKRPKTLPNARIVKSTQAIKPTSIIPRAQ